MAESARLVRMPEEVRAFVEAQKLGFVATVGSDGSPNVSPKGTVTVWDAEHLVFADLASPATVCNLARDPRVHVNVVDPIARKGWRFEGTAEVVRSGERFEAGVRFFERLDLPDAPKRIRSLVWVRVRAIAPLISPAYASGRTEAEVRERAWAGYRALHRAALGRAAPALGTDRRFARFAEDRPPGAGYWPLPDDGLCLSSFVLLSPRDSPNEVLLGRLDPAGGWDRIGALDPLRVQRNAEGWMLPSCHLRYFEAPDEAARRVLDEQLGLAGLALGPPSVFSERYRPRRHPERGEHWDLEFLYRATAPAGWAPRHPAWRELRFLDPSATPRAEFARSHEEVLELAGYRIG
jgi:predicted pyridoxine 5'-phosphate oxidase superfamily flavin-nucleotide-binding protein